jgi:hypothetical protein
MLNFPKLSFDIKFIESEGWWARQDLNLWPSRCHRDALPTELRARFTFVLKNFGGRGWDRTIGPHFLILSTDKIIYFLKFWWAWMGSNHRPPLYKSDALPLSYTPTWFPKFLKYIRVMLYH